MVNGSCYIKVKQKEPLLDPGQKCFILYKTVEQKEPLWDPGKKCFILYKNVKQKGAYLDGPQHKLFFVTFSSNCAPLEWCQIRIRQTLAGRVAWGVTLSKRGQIWSGCKNYQFYIKTLSKRSPFWTQAKNASFYIKTASKRSPCRTQEKSASFYTNSSIKRGHVWMASNMGYFFW